MAVRRKSRFYLGPDTIVPMWWEFFKNVLLVLGIFIAITLFIVLIGLFFAINF